MTPFVNHLLAQEPGARGKLVKHAGKTAWIDTGALVIRWQVTAEGLVETAMATANQPPNVTIRMKFADLPLIMQNREQAFSYVTVEGDADFANTISQLLQTLRWEAEEDLRKWVGDIASVRIVSTVKGIFNAARTMQQKFAENTAEYFLEENPMLVRPQATSGFSAEVTKLRDDVERLAKRIDKLEKLES